MATARAWPPTADGSADRSRATGALQALNFFMADMQAGIGPFLGVFLQQRGWTAGPIGTVMTAGGVAGMVMTVPAGAFIDQTEKKRLVVIVTGICTVMASFLILLSQAGWVVTVSQVATAIAGAAIGPAVAGMTLGIVRQRGFNPQNGRNQAWNHAGNMVGAGLSVGSFALPSAAAIAVTFLALRWAERDRLSGPCATDVAREPLSGGGKAALAGIAATALLLLAMSALDRPLGLPTCLAGLTTTLLVCTFARRSPLVLARSVSWSVLPLVAGLFVLVEALDRTGVIATVAHQLRAVAGTPLSGAATAGTVLAFASNLMNNLPAGLIASEAVAQAHPPRLIVDALLIGVDLGPNLSITGSLATILWLQAIRREGEYIGFWRFLKIGAVTMVPALAAALGARLLLG